jgi:hypothetical protein
MGTLARQTICVLAFLCGLLLASAAFRGRTPYHRDDYILPKVVHALNSSPPYGVLFLGSSMVARGVNPATFDRVASERLGKSVRSFNLARPGAFTLQLERPIQIIAQSPSRPRFVVVELARMEPDIEADNLYSERMIGCHDFATMMLAIPATLRRDDGIATLLGRLRVRLGHFLLNNLRVGGYVEVLTGEPQGWGWRNIDAAAVRRGFTSFDHSRAEMRAELWDADCGAREAAFARNENWDRRVARWPEYGAELAAQGKYRGMGPYALARRESALRAAGIVPIFVVMPQGDPLPLVLEEARAAGLTHVIDLNDAVRIPELFARENRFDTWHLNGAGAEVVSSLLAERIAPIIASYDE